MLEKKRPEMLWKKYLKIGSYSPCPHFTIFYSDSNSLSASLTKSDWIQSERIPKRWTISYSSSSCLPGRSPIHKDSDVSNNEIKLADPNGWKLNTPGNTYLHIHLMLNSYNSCKVSITDIHYNMYLCTL